jgi:signal transduction histidine kinase
MSMIDNGLGQLDCLEATRKRFVQSASETTLRVRDKSREPRKDAQSHLSQCDLHDLRNFLCAIATSAELMTQDTESGSTGKSRINLIVVAARNAIRLVQSEGEPRGTSAPQLLGPEAVVGETVAVLETFRGPKTELNCALDNDVPPLAMDTADLQRIVMNLFINACQAIGDTTGSISLTLQPALQTGLPCALLEVVDTGIGMDPATVSKIFQTHFTTKRNGHGLGLATVKDIVEKYDGTLAVESTEGVGTKFTVHIPCETTAIVETRTGGLR